MPLHFSYKSIYGVNLSVFTPTLISVKEAKFNTIIKNTLDTSYGYGYKISDVGGGKQQRRPFDGFGLYNGKPLYWEAKRTKGLTAFNLKEVFEGERGHQMSTFDVFFRNLEDPSSVYLWVILLSYIPRKPRVYTFDFLSLRALYYENNKTSIHKKQLEELPYTTIYKGLIQDFNSIGDVKDEHRRVLLS